MGTINVSGARYEDADYYYVEPTNSNVITLRPTNGSSSINEQSAGSWKISGTGYSGWEEFINDNIHVHWTDRKVYGVHGYEQIKFYFTSPGTYDIQTASTGVNGGSYELFSMSKRFMVAVMPGITLPASINKEAGKSFTITAMLTASGNVKNATWSVTKNGAAYTPGLFTPQGFDNATATLKIGISDTGTYAVKLEIETDNGAKNGATTTITITDPVQIPSFTKGAKITVTDTINPSGLDYVYQEAEDAGFTVGVKDRETTKDKETTIGVPINTVRHFRVAAKRSDGVMGDWSNVVKAATMNPISTGSNFEVSIPDAKSPFVKMTWMDPPESGWAKTIIVMNQDKYPESLTDGVIVKEATTAQYHALNPFYYELKDNNSDFYFQLFVMRLDGEVFFSTKNRGKVTYTGDIVYWDVRNNEWIYVNRTHEEIGNETGMLYSTTVNGCYLEMNRFINAGGSYEETMKVYNPHMMPGDIMVAELFDNTGETRNGFEVCMGRTEGRKSPGTTDVEFSQYWHPSINHVALHIVANESPMPYRTYVWNTHKMRIGRIGAPMSAPTNFRVTGTTASTISLAWNAVVGAKTYEIRIDGKIIYSGSDLQYTHSIDAGRSYVFKLIAKKDGYCSPATSLSAGVDLDLTPYMIGVKTINEIRLSGNGRYLFIVEDLGNGHALHQYDLWNKTRKEVFRNDYLINLVGASSDGNRVCFVDLKRESGVQEPRKVIEISTNRTFTINTGDTENIIHGEYFSGNGLYYAFNHNVPALSNAENTVIVNVESGQRTALAVAETNVFNNIVALSYDGQTVMYVRSPGSGSSDTLYWYQNGTKLEVMRDPLIRSLESTQAISGDGRTLVYHDLYDDELRIAKSNGSVISGHYLLESSAWDPEVNYDGTSVVYQVNGSDWKEIYYAKLSSTGSVISRKSIGSMAGIYTTEKGISDDGRIIAYRNDESSRVCIRIV